MCVRAREVGVVSTRKHKLKLVPSPRRSVSVREPVACSFSSVHPLPLSFSSFSLGSLYIYIPTWRIYVYFTSWAFLSFWFCLEQIQMDFFQWWCFFVFFFLLPSLLFPLTACVTPACLPSLQPPCPPSHHPPYACYPCSSSQPARTFTWWSCAVTATTTATTKTKPGPRTWRRKYSAAPLLFFLPRL